MTTCHMTDSEKTMSRRTCVQKLIPSGYALPAKGGERLCTMAQPRANPYKTVPADVQSERALAFLWRRAESLPDGLVTQDGRRVRVIYPGRPNHRAGPDFHDAIIANEAGELLHGDVELHLNAPDWYAHRHHRDPNYNGVILHVVLRAKEAVETTQLSGVKAPVAVLEPPPARDPRAPAPASSISLSGGPTCARDLGKTLDRAGDERFVGRSRGFAMELERADADEVLYAAILEALGYASNRSPFRELAKRVPFDSLKWLRDEPRRTRAMAIKAAVLGASGLLPGLRPAEEASQLARLCRSMPTTRRMSASSWKLFRVRPANHPLRRVAGAALLVDRYIESGMVNGLGDLRGATPRLLIERLAAPPLVGAGRAAEIAVNVVLPFLHAHASLGGASEAKSAALDLFRTFPPLADNEITREMKTIIGAEADAVDIRSARRQQGLITLYKGMTSSARAA